MTSHSRRAGRWPLRSYSQNAEDVRLWRVFGHLREGFYVDAGAGHPTIGSVTRLFYDRGWSGINIEPGPMHAELVAARSRDVNLQVAVGPVEETTEFFVAYPDVHLSTVDKDLLQSSDRIERVDATRVSQRRLDTILAEYASDRRIDFLKVDVQGAEQAVLGSSDWTRFRPAVVLVEAIRAWDRVIDHDEWEDILTRNGYLFATFDGINRFYVSEEARALVEELAYPVSALDNYMPLGEHTAIKRADAARERLEERIGELEIENRALLAETAASNRRGRAAAKRLPVVAGKGKGRVSQAARRLIGPARPVLRPAVRFARKGVRAPRRILDEYRRARRPPSGAELVDSYRRALAPGLAHEFPLPGSQLPPLSGGAGRPLARLRAVMEGVPGSPEPTRETLDAAIEATARLDESVLAERELSFPIRNAIIHAELAGVLRNPPPSAAEIPRSNPNRRPGDPPLVIVDARCLQSPSYRDRGVGRHAAHVLRTIADLYGGTREMVLLVDPGLPPLDRDLGKLAPRCIAAVDPRELADVALFLELSPMTASPGPILTLLSTPGIRCVAVVYDFIPAEHPDPYLRLDERCIVYRAQLEALSRYDFFLAISDATASALARVLGRNVPASVTGVAGLQDTPGVDPGGMDAFPTRFRNYAVVMSGSDPRKNLLAAIAAHALSVKARKRRMGLVVLGNVTKEMIDAARDFATRCGIPNRRISFLTNATDRQLCSLYSRAKMVLVPSFAEGFSIPVVEAICAGIPVVASRIEAHEELLSDGWWLAAPDDPMELATCIDRALADRARLLRRQQAAIGDRFTAEAVAARIKDALPSRPQDGAAGPARPERTSRKRPRLAIFTPFPPQHSGIADYSKVTMRAVASYADVVVYGSPTCEVEPGSGIELQPHSIAPHVDRDFDAVVSVLGNSHFHIPALEYFLEFGGACIAHDPRMAEIYRAWRGSGHLTTLLSRHSDERVLARDLSHMMADPDRFPAAVFDEIAPRARPLLVHSAGLARRIRAETGVEAVVLPYVPHRTPFVEKIDSEIVDSARRFLEWSSDGYHVVTFGIVSRRTKASEVVVDAIAWLREWGIDCSLHVVGPAASMERSELLARARRLGVSKSVRLTGRVSLDVLDAHLLGADAAVQLRTYSQGPLSGALLDCIAFGAPTVATASLVTEMEAPAYIRGVPDRFSGLLLAEALAPMLEARRFESAAALDADRRDWLTQRTTDIYAQRLLNALGLW